MTEGGALGMTGNGALRVTERDALRMAEGELLRMTESGVTVDTAQTSPPAAQAASMPSWMVLKAVAQEAPFSAPVLSLSTYQTAACAWRLANASARTATRNLAIPREATAIVDATSPSHGVVQ